MFGRRYKKFTPTESEIDSLSTRITDRSLRFDYDPRSDVESAKAWPEIDESNRIMLLLELRLLIFSVMYVRTGMALESVKAGQEMQLYIGTMILSKFLCSDFLNKAEQEHLKDTPSVDITEYFFFATHSEAKRMVVSERIGMYTDWMNPELRGERPDMAIVSDFLLNQVFPFLQEDITNTEDRSDIELKLSYAAIKAVLSLTVASEYSKSVRFVLDEFKKIY